MISQSFSKEIFKRHQRNRHAWSCGKGEWGVRHCRTIIVRLEGRHANLCNKFISSTKII